MNVDGATWPAGRMRPRRPQREGVLTRRNGGRRVGAKGNGTVGGTTIDTASMGMANIGMADIGMAWPPLRGAEP